jgi:hypothetical protein
VKHLEGMTKLRHLTLRNTSLTAYRVARLREFLPKAEVSSDSFTDRTCDNLLSIEDQESPAVRGWLTTQFRRQIATVHRICDLTPVQKQKLRLAGRADIERLVERIRVWKQNIRDNGLRLDLARKRATLLRSLHSGPFVESSLFIKVLGGILTPDQAAKYEPFREIMRHGVPVQVWPGSAAGVEAIRLSGVTCTDETLADILGLAGLRLLALHGTRVTDEGLSRLKQLHNLQELWIAGTKISHGAVAALEQEMPGLKVRR